MRIDTITAHLTTGAGQYAAAITTDDAEDWWDFAPDDPTEMHRPFGWMPPAGGPAGLEVHFCPAVIDTQTSDLSDAHLAVYLDAVVFHCQQHIVHAHLQPADLEREIDDLLYGIAPNSASLVSRVQLAALDPARP